MPLCQSQLKVIPPVLHRASLLRIIYGVISARSYTRTLKTWRICLDILSVEKWL